MGLAVTYSLMKRSWATPPKLTALCQRRRVDGGAFKSSQARLIQVAFKIVALVSDSAMTDAKEAVRVLRLLRGVLA